MSAKRFKFVSPGIFINEIDNSQLPRERAPVGPVVIGRLNRGPGLRPVTVQSFSEFVEVFGSPEPGGMGDDVWRNGNSLAPTYAAYAAQAYLRNAGPVTVVRTLGVEHPEATDAGKAGWKMGSHVDDTTPANNGGVYGLFLFSSGSQKYTSTPIYGDSLIRPGRAETRKGGASDGSENDREVGTRMTGSLAAVWYFDQGGMVLSGSFLPGVELHDADTDNEDKGEGALNSTAIRSVAEGDYEFTALLYDKVSSSPKKITFNFNRNSDRYIRKVFNTNPALLGDTNTLNKQLGYFLGESFDRSVKDLHGASTLNSAGGSGDSSLFGAIVALDNGTVDWGLNQKVNQPSKTGWFFAQDLTDDYAKYDATKQQKLFKFCSLYDGAWSAKNIKISITEHRAATEVNPYGSFSVLVRRVSDSDAAPVVLERFSNCNLNPNSSNYIARKIGDQYQEWDAIENRYRVYNQYANQSSFIRVEVDSDVDAGITDPSNLPFGVYGPPKYKSLKMRGLIMDDDTRQGSATAMLETADTGNQAHGLAAGQKLTLTDSDGKTVEYFVSDTGNGAAGVGHVAHLGVVVEGATLDDGVTATLTAGATGVAVGFDLGGGGVTQNGFLTLLKAAIESANGHNGTIEVSADVADNAGAQNTRILSMRKAGRVRSAAVSETLAKINVGSAFAVTVSPLETVFGNVVSGSYVTRNPNVLASKNAFISVLSGSGLSNDVRPVGLKFDADDFTNVPLKTADFFGTFVSSSAGGGTNMIVGIPVSTGSATPGVGDPAVITFPSLPLRVSSSDEGLQNQKKAFFGVSTYRAPSSTRFEESYLDLVSGYQGRGATYDVGDGEEYQFVFSLDDLVVGGNSNGRGSTKVSSDVSTMFYHSGSRQQNESYTALQRNYTDLINTGFTSFTSPMYGGVDGLTIKEREPFGDHLLKDKTFKESSAAFSLKRSIDSIQDPEAIEMNIATVPGIRAPLVTNHLLNVVEDRADAIAIIDPEKGGYQPSTETKSDFKTRITNNSVALAVEAIKNRGLNTSYGCAYYPWVKIYDEINDKQVWVPPSVVALGTFASTQARSELWFAPAGFTRGGLTEGSAGLPVLGVSQRLSSKDRDDLYENNINPIAQFPAEGIVIFGQKTLQVTPSALDRINVRRLMVFLKKQISIIASRLIFDQNVQATWNRFRGQVEPFLEGVKARLGLVDFRVILDDTTTTPELIDRNIMYAKIFLKPARSIEFIAIDFVITNSGASFDD